MAAAPPYVPSRPIVLIGLLWSLLVTPAYADLSLFCTIESSQSGAQSRVQSQTDVRGPWVRRELTGEGILAAYLGRTIEIMNRATGERFRLYPADRTYAVDSIDILGCSPSELADLRPLGQVQAGIESHLVDPGPMRDIGNWRAQPVELSVQSTYGVRTAVVFWISDHLDSLFGSALASDTWCTDNILPVAGRALANRVARRFQLSLADDAVYFEHMRGFPVRIEGRSEQDSVISSLTVIRLDSVHTNTLPDALFRPPVDYSKRPAGDSDGK